MRSLRNMLIGFGAIPLLSSGASAGQTLQVVWSSGHFETIAGTATGNEIGHSSGFAITDDKGTELYSSGSPGDHSPCYNVENGRTFQISSSCWNKPRWFHCLSDFGGNPKICEVQRDGDYKVLASGKSNVKDKFIGIAVSQSGYCGASFELDGNEKCDKSATFKFVKG